ncbi:MAG TPA: hypothetical protein EYQ43_05445 [Methyloprofundus sp.]|jgi:Sodium/hydrogen exchanger family.|nr:hypothetical protein [Methyloprofundus sp.]HIL77501.1 hypothetical protein [Methylococcales bacterium]
MLMIVVWGVSVVMRKIGLPTIMGEQVRGVAIDPAALDWFTPNEVITNIGTFFLMLHTEIETEPREFYAAVMDSFALNVNQPVAYSSYQTCSASMGLFPQTPKVCLQR